MDTGHTTMKCVEVSAFARSYDFDEVLSIREDHDRPCREPGKRQLLVRVMACSLAPGDCRVASGHCELYQAPPEGFPYIPGGDISGIVAEVDDDDEHFQVGDAVIATFESPRPLHGLAEYIVVDAKRAEKFNDDKISFVDAACLPSSALAALNLSTHLSAGDRVMVLGGSGGVGPFLVQLCKLAGVEFVACTSTDKEMMEAIGADRVIDYSTVNWWELDEFKAEPFDVVFDLIGGPTGWAVIRNCEAVKRSPSNGRYLPLAFDQALIEVHNYWDLVCFMCKFIGRAIWNRLVQRSIPYYRMIEGLKLHPSSFQTLLGHVEAGRLKVLQDPASPFEFTDKDVKAAFHLQASRHAHGKVVVQIAHK